MRDERKRKRKRRERGVGKERAENWREQGLWWRERRRAQKMRKLEWPLLTIVAQFFCV